MEASKIILFPHPFYTIHRTLCIFLSCTLLNRITLSYYPYIVQYKSTVRIFSTKENGNSHVLAISHSLLLLLDLQPAAFRTASIYSIYSLNDFDIYHTMFKHLLPFARPATSSCRQLRTIAKKELPTPKFEKRLDIVILGTPNVGKSVILNKMVDSKIAATSRKQHTTRSEILGVFNYRNTQLAFYDTPGYIRKVDARKADTRTLNATAAATAKKADVALIVVDSARCKSVHYHDAFCELVRLGLDNAKKEIILVLNKVDLINPKSELLDITRMLVSLVNGVKLGPGNEHKAKLDTTTFMISALENDGLVDMKNYLIGSADMKPWVLSADEGVTGSSMESRVEEIVLEKLLEHTHEEIPYIADIECTDIQPLRGRIVEVNVNIWIDTPGQQRIIVGQQGRTLVKLRQSAVEDLEGIMDKKVILRLWVKLRNGKEMSYKMGNDDTN